MLEADLQESPMPDSTYYVGHNKYKRCNHCGIGFLHWNKSKSSGNWRLYDKNGQIHNCNKKFKNGKRIVFK